MSGLLDRPDVDQRTVVPSGGRFPSAILTCRPNSHPFQERTLYGVHEQVCPRSTTYRVLWSKYLNIPNNDGFCFSSRLAEVLHGRNLWTTTPSLTARSESQPCPPLVQGGEVFPARHQELQWDVCQQQQTEQRSRRAEGNMLRGHTSVRSRCARKCQEANSR